MINPELEKKIISKLNDKILKLRNKIEQKSINTVAQELWNKIKNNPKILLEKDMSDAILKLFIGNKVYKSIAKALDILGVIMRNPNFIRIDTNDERLNLIKYNLLNINDVLGIDSSLINSDMLEVSIYAQILDKVNKSDKGIEYFDDKEIERILDLFDDSKEKIRVLDYISTHSEIVYKNRIDKLNVIEENEEEIENITAIDEDLLIDTFKKYGFDYNILTPEYKDMISRYCNIDKLEDLLRYISTKNEYSFIKNYGKPSKNKTHEILRFEIRKLYSILRYSSVDILEHLLTFSKNKNLDLKTIFTVPGVFRKSKKKDTNIEIIDGSDNLSFEESASYDYFMENSRFFEELSKYYQIEFDDININLLETTLDNCSTIFCVNSSLVKQNIGLAQQYGLDVVSKNKFGVYTIKAVSQYISKDFLTNLDLMIENSSYEYVRKYPAILHTNEKIKEIIYRNKKGILRFNNNGTLKDTNEQYRDESYLYELKDNLRKEIDSLNIDSSIIGESTAIYNSIFNYNNNSLDKYRSSIMQVNNDEVVKILDETATKTPNISYEINGVLISIPKFKSVWAGLKDKVTKDNIKDLLFFALTYNGYYRIDEIETIKSFINEMKLGGLAL